MGNPILKLQKVMGFISGIVLIIYGYIFNYKVGTLHGGMERFTYLAVLLLVIGGINILIVIISYFKKSIKIDSLIGIRFILLSIGGLLYLFKDTQKDYNFFLTCMYLDFGIIACITTLRSMGFKIIYKKRYTNIVIFIIALLQSLLLSLSIKEICSYASNRCVRILIVWLGINVVLLSFMSLKSKS